MSDAAGRIWWISIEAEAEAYSLYEKKVMPL